MGTFARRAWPLICVIGIYWAIVAVLFLLSIRRNDGHLVYALDDAYIHMAIAKNYALHGVWGVTRYEFTSSTSSPLWTFLLFLLFSRFGVNEIYPLVLNVVFGTLVLLASYSIVHEYVVSGLRVFVLLLAVLFVTPLASLTFVGMEHTMHGLLTLCFAHFCSRMLTSSHRRNWVGLALPFVLAPFLTTARYEGMFLVVIVCILCVLCGRFLWAVLLSGIGFLPVIAYGLWTLSKGWFFLPTSVVLKGNIPALSVKGILKLVLGYAALENITENPRIFALVVSSLLVFLVYSKKARLLDATKLMIAIFVGTTVLHMQFARVGHFFRYEAYLILLGVVVVGIAAGRLLPDRFTLRINRELLPGYAAAGLLAVVAVSPFGFVSLNALRCTPQATHNIYQQQYQMGLFLSRYYQGNSVVANDIGALTYLADVRLIDLLGLGTIETAQLISRGNYGSQGVLDLVKRHDARVAIAYEHCVRQMGAVPPQWQKVGEWVIPNNVVCGDDAVLFFSLIPCETEHLRENLKAFFAYLPDGVLQYGEHSRR